VPSRAGAATPSLRRRKSARRSAAKRSSSAPTKRSPVAPEKRPAAYWVVAGIRLDQELERLRVERERAAEAAQLELDLG
jgi:hypothetical protein